LGPFIPRAALSQALLWSALAAAAGIIGNRADDILTTCSIKARICSHWGGAPGGRRLAKVHAWDRAFRLGPGDGARINAYLAGAADLQP
jgi:hypothetical protein